MKAVVTLIDGSVITVDVYKTIYSLEDISTYFKNKELNVLNILNITFIHA